MLLKKLLRLLDTEAVFKALGTTKQLAKMPLNTGEVLSNVFIKNAVS